MKAVIAESYEKIHKSHLIGMGIAPLQFLPEENATFWGLTGKEQFSISFPHELSPGISLDVKVTQTDFWMQVLVIEEIYFFLEAQMWWSVLCCKLLMTQFYGIHTISHKVEV